MTKDDFLNELNEIMQRETPLKTEDVLSAVGGWDSMSGLGVMSMFDFEFNVAVSVDQLKAVITVQDLIDLAGDKVIN